MTRAYNVRECALTIRQEDRRSPILLTLERIQLTQRVAIHLVHLTNDRLAETSVYPYEARVVPYDD